VYTHPYFSLPARVGLCEKFACWALPKPIEKYELSCPVMPHDFFSHHDDPSFAKQ
jgi:hypothetical protein